MKKKLVLIGSSLVLASSLNAFSIFHDRDIDNDLSRLNAIIQSLQKDFLDNHQSNFIRMNVGYPAMHISEDDKKYTIEFEVAGMEKKDIKVTISNKNILTVEGEKIREEESKNTQIIKSQFFTGKFQKSITLPDNIDTNSIKISYNNGILKIVANKKEPTNIKRVIPIS